MARTAFRAQITETTPYTVPAGKTAVFKAYYQDTNAMVTIAGVAVARFATNVDYDMQYGPLTANAGDVIATPSLSADVEKFSIVGFLYDN